MHLTNKDTVRCAKGVLNRGLPLYMRLHSLQDCQYTCTVHVYTVLGWISVVHSSGVRQSIVGACMTVNMYTMDIDRCTICRINGSLCSLDCVMLMSAGRHSSALITQCVIVEQFVAVSLTVLTFKGCRFLAASWSWGQA